jgi:hypothetical protein
VGNTSRSTIPLRDSSHCPWVNGAVALASIGMPTPPATPPHAVTAQRWRDDE